MDYFFQRCFRGTKSLFGVIGGVACATVITLGAIGIQTIAIPICGAVALIPVGFIFFENTKVVRDMEKYVSLFKLENKQLHKTNTDLKQTNIELKQTKDDLVKSNERYGELLDQAENNIDIMKQLAVKYKTTSEQLGFNLQQTEKNHELLKQQAEELIKIKNDYDKENKSLKSTVNQIESQLKIVLTNNKTYEVQLSEMKDTSESLRLELEKTRKSYQESKELCKNLLQASGILEDLSNDMIKTEQKTEANVDRLTAILNMFGREKAIELFHKFDKDENKQLSLDEYIELVLTGK
jgi:chromosome segregation ATPase